jgi:hypothetical protein
MSRIGTLWAGKIYGTNTGNVFVELNPTDGKFSGTLRLSDDRFGLSAYSLCKRNSPAAHLRDVVTSLSGQNTGVKNPGDAGVSASRR